MATSSTTTCEKQVASLQRYPASTPVFFVRCQLFDAGGKLLVENVYWQSQEDDDLGARKNDLVLDLRQDSWADMTALNTMPRVDLRVRAVERKTANGSEIAIRLHNPSQHIAFFERATISATSDGGEILPIEYDDNYITSFPANPQRSTGGFLRAPRSAGSKWKATTPARLPSRSIGTNLHSYLNSRPDDSAG